MQTQKKLHGMLLASLASSLWAISGISGEILFKKFNFSSDWLVSTRTLISGILLFAIVIFIEKKSVLKPLKNKKDCLGIILFGTAGMYLVQYTYFKTIELSNVSFATILQFTAPFFIFVYESAKNKKIAICFNYNSIIYDNFRSCIYSDKREFLKFICFNGSISIWTCISYYDSLLFNISKKTSEKIWKYNSSLLGNDSWEHNFKYYSSNLEN